MTKENSKKPLEEVKENVLDPHRLPVGQITSIPKRIHISLCFFSSSFRLLKLTRTFAP